ncbi:hypothetical protein HDV05_003417 [Chytridiales sp. JEL 0842]|nr:hypothetical protein HDV05_003417 [Chytridiales sp. JEL 0842]
MNNKILSPTSPTDFPTSPSSSSFQLWASTASQAGCDAVPKDSMQEGLHDDEVLPELVDATTMSDHTASDDSDSDDNVKQDAHHDELAQDEGIEEIGGDCRSHHIAFEKGKARKSPVNRILARVPEEVWMRFLMFVEDTDLPSLSNTSRLLQRLCADHILHHHFHLRNKYRLNSLLFQTPQRPTRLDLARSNIIPGLSMERRLTMGDYVYSELSVRAFLASQILDREMKIQQLHRGLTARPQLEEVSARNLIPPLLSSSSFVGTRLLTKVMRLEKEMKLDALRRQLRTRKSKQDLKEIGLGKAFTLPPTLLPQALLLDHHLRKLLLVSQLIKRPSPTVLTSLKVLKEDAGAAVLICPSIKDRLEFFESFAAAANESSEEKGAEVDDEKMHGRERRRAPSASSFTRQSSSLSGGGCGGRSRQSSFTREEEEGDERGEWVYPPSVVLALAGRMSVGGRQSPGLDRGIEV